MVHAFLVFAAEGASTPSKAPFYIAAGLFAVWAVVLAALGLSQPDFPRDGGASRAVMGISTVLMVAAMTTAVVTA
jgi:hypothetical protein